MAITYFLSWLCRVGICVKPLLDTKVGVPSLPCLCLRFTKVYIFVENGENFALERVIVWLVQHGWILFTTAITLYVDESVEMFYSGHRPSLCVRGVQVTQNCQDKGTYCIIHIHIYSYIKR